MKVALKSKLAMLPLLACSTLACATEPVLLNMKEMDHVTAGTQPVLEKLGNVLVTAGTDVKLSDLLSLTPDQKALISQLGASGQQVLIKQLSAADAAALLQTNPDALVTTHVLNREKR